MLMGNNTPAYRLDYYNYISNCQRGDNKVSEIETFWKSALNC